MKKLFMLFILAKALTVTASVTVPVIPPDGWQNIADDFGSTEIFFLKDREKQKAEAKIQPDGIRFQWTPGKETYFQAHLVRPLLLPEFDEAVIHLTADLSAGSPHRFNLRLIDRDGEIFHFSKTSAGKGTGKKRFSYQIIPEKPSGSNWGGGKKANRKIDFPVRFLGFTASGGKTSGHCVIVLHKVELEILRGNTPLKLTLHNGLPIPVIRPGEEKNVEVHLQSWRTDTVRGEIDWKIYGLDDKERASGKCCIELRPGEEFILRPSLPALSNGVYFLMVSLNGTPLKTFRCAVMPPSGPTPERASGFLFGVVDHPLSYPWRDQRLEAITAALCGAKIFRFNPLWSVVEPRRGQRKYAKIDRLYDLFGKYGIEFQILFSGTPKWAVANDWKPLTAGRNKRGFWAARPDYDAYAAHVRDFAARYKGRSRYYEIWNEADLPQFANFSVDEYLELLRRGYAAIKSADPDAVVMTTGFASTTTNFRVPKQGILERVLAERDSYDVIAFHGHVALNTYHSRLNTLFRLREKAHSEAPWYANETAISSAIAGENGQAVVLFQKFLATRARGGIGLNWYNLRSKGGEGFKDSAYENAFGLVTKDYEPKAAYVAFNALTGLYRNSSFLRDLSNKSLTGYLFRTRDGTQLFAHWNKNGLGESLLLFSRISGTPSLVDLYGNETPLVTENGLLPLRISELPATLKVTGQKTELAIGQELLRAENPFSITPGENGEFRFTVTNPLNNRLSLSLQLQLPETFVCSRPGQKIQLKPRECREIGFLVNSPEAFRSYAAHPEKLKLTVIGGNWQETLSFPVLSNIQIPVGSFSPEPQFRLDNQKQVVSYAISGPENHLLWTGPEDLSANVWLAGDHDTLRLKIVVTDDVHCQPYRDGDVWRGDNVQFAIQLPGQNSFWEFGLSLCNGSSEVFCWQAPRGFSAPKTSASIRLKISRDEAVHQTVYKAEIPRAALGLSDSVGKAGFRFNLLVNDNDGEKRESSMSIAPGIERNKNPAKFPFVSFR